MFDEEEASPDGLKSVARIRAKDRLIPIVLITWRICEARAIAALRLGVDDYYAGPAETDEVAAGIGKLLARSQPQTSNAEQAPCPRCFDYKLVGESVAMKGSAHLLAEGRRE